MKIFCSNNQYISMEPPGLHREQKEKKIEKRFDL